MLNDTANGTEALMLRQSDTPLRMGAERNWVPSNSTSPTEDAVGDKVSDGVIV